MNPVICDPTYQQKHPTEQKTMNDDILFMKHLASRSNADSLWHLVVDHSSDAPVSVPVVRIRVYRGASSSDEPIADATIPLESSYPLSGAPDYASFVAYRQARLKDAVAMLRVFALNNHDEKTNRED